jgi:hypothetical protein
MGLWRCTRRTRLARLQYSRDDSVCHAASHGFLRCVPVAMRSCPLQEVRLYWEIGDAQHGRRAKSNVIARPGKTTCADLAPPTDPPLEAPPRSARTTRLDHLGFPKRESPLRQLPDERGEFCRCPFRHVHENVVLRFVRLLEELVLDIRILFRTRAVRRHPVP